MTMDVQCQSVVRLANLLSHIERVAPVHLVDFPLDDGVCAGGEKDGKRDGPDDRFNAEDHGKSKKFRVV